MNNLMFDGMEYLIRYPANYTEGKRYPVVLFLHGAGTRGDDITILKNNSFMKIIPDRYEEYSFILVAPHCKHGTWFDHFETLTRFTKSIAAAAYTDPARLYLVGNSMGGYGTWQLAMSMPEYFAAILPICGGGMYWNAARLVNVPVWAFHGECDNVVHVDESKRMVEAINGKGGNAKLTLYPDTKHDCWTVTYQNKAVFEWLFAQRNQNAKALVDGFSNNSIYG